MLTADSVTVAVEVPVYITVEEFAELKATHGLTILI
jgi:hypothetical protein